MNSRLTTERLQKRFAISERARAKLVSIGRSREPVIVIDDLLQDPLALIDAAANGANFRAADENRGGYPGICAAAPLAYVGPLLQYCDPIIRQTFGASPAQPMLTGNRFSLVTASPASLHPLQRIPHIDTSEPDRFAILLYLCEPPFGGTAFYRHEATGYEQVTPATRQVYLDTRRQELTQRSPSLGYPTAVTPGYRQTAQFGMRMNRLLIYRSCSLHSAVFPDSVPLSPDPHRGRLTANIFVKYRSVGLP